MQVSRLIWICRAHRDKCSIKPQVRAVAFWGVLDLLQKAYSLGFSARRPPQGQAALLTAVGVCPDKTCQNKPVPFGVADWFGLFWRKGSVEKVGVEPDPKRVGPASWNLEHGLYPMPPRPCPQARGRTRASSRPQPPAAPSRRGRRSRACGPRRRARSSSPPRSTWTPAMSRPART